MSIKFNEEIKYKELCQMLGEVEVVGGTNREKQLKRLNKKYVIEKAGRGKYIIERKRTKEEIKLNSDTQNYSRYLQAILLNMIANNPEIEMIFTYRQIRENLMMVNSKYFPVKYHKEKIEYKVPSVYENDPDSKPIYFLEQDWIEVADQHDKAAIKYALKRLKEKGLLTNLTETYLFYKFEKDAEGNTIFHEPIEATKEQLSEIHQLQLEYIKENISEYEIENCKKDEENYYSRLIKTLYHHGENVVKGYYEIIENYIKNKGYDRYARAFKILKPIRLEKVVGYFAPKFNEKQVERYLTNRRFDAMPIFFHNQIVDKLIKEG